MAATTTKPLQHLINVHFFSPSLGAYLLNNNSSGSNNDSPGPAMIYFVYNAKLVGAVVGHDLTTGELVAQIPYFPVRACRVCASVCARPGSVHAWEGSTD